MSKNSKNTSKKTVRFASPKHANLFIEKPVLTNTYQIGELCNKCGTYRVGPSTDLGCKNCLIPKPNGNSSLSKSEFLSRSKENLNKLNETQIKIENPVIIPEILETIKDIKEEHLNKSKLCPMPIKPRKNSMTNSSWKCFSCQKHFNPGEVAIIAEHVDPKGRWHPQCFTCCICDKFLVDLLYFNKGKNIYCENHFKEEIIGKICGACDLQIRSKEYISAENNFWHLEHFICWDCEMSLADQKYVVVESKPFCFKCHQKAFAKFCQTCKKEIQPDQARFTYEKLNWHSRSECFKCASCQKDLIDCAFLLKKNLLFCSIDCKKHLIKN